MKSKGKIVKKKKGITDSEKENGQYKERVGGSEKWKGMNKILVGDICTSIYSYEKHKQWRSVSLLINSKRTKEKPRENESKA